MASELILVLRDFSVAESTPVRDAQLPRLPALERLLSTARRTALQHGWRYELRARFASTAQASLAPAAVVAASFGLASATPPDVQYWLATPVHCFAGLDSVQLHPAGLLELAPDTQAALVAQFDHLFADTPWRLHATGGREMLLSGPPVAASAADPAASVGADLRAGLPQGPEAATLRRLGVEIEMWLHEHRINRERQARGDLPVTGLWLWGSVAPDRAASVAHRAQDQPPQRPHLFGQDVYLESLWRLQGGRVEPLPERFADSAGAGAGARIVLYPTLCSDGLLHALGQLEERWLAPAMAALRSRQLSVVSLLADSRAYSVTRLRRAQFWRVSAPWWEALV